MWTICRRIKKLVDMEALGLSRVAVIVLDMHTDVKGYSLFTLPQVRSGFFSFSIFSDISCFLTFISDIQTEYFTSCYCGIMLSLKSFHGTWTSHRLTSWWVKGKWSSAPFRTSLKFVLSAKFCYLDYPIPHVNFSFEVGIIYCY